MISADIKKLQGITVTYSYEAYLKCAHWVQNAKNKAGHVVEVGWEGLIEVRRNANGPGMHDYYVKDCFLWPGQTGGHGSVISTPEGQASLATWYAKNGIERGNALHWGHSHGDGEPFQSAVDTGNVEDAYGFGPEGHRSDRPAAPFCVAVTWNASLKTYCDVTFFEPIHIRITNVPVEFEMPKHPAIDVAAAELAERFTPNEWKAPALDNAWKSRYGLWGTDDDDAVDDTTGKLLEPRGTLTQRDILNKLLANDKWFIITHDNKLLCGYAKKKHVMDDPRATNPGNKIVDRQQYTMILEREFSARLRPDVPKTPTLSWLTGLGTSGVGLRVNAMPLWDVRGLIRTHLVGWWIRLTDGQVYDVGERGLVTVRPKGGTKVGEGMVVDDGIALRNVLKIGVEEYIKKQVKEVVS